MRLAVAVAVMALVPATTMTPGAAPLAAASVTKSPEVRADVNGDGYGELVVAASGAKVTGLQGRRHGTVSVLYASASGVTTKDQLWHRDSPGVKGVASRGADYYIDAGGFFGEPLATGDFNGDGYTDVVASARGNEKYGDVPWQRTAVNVLYGSTEGLTAAGDQLWSLASPGVKGHWGWGDFEDLTTGDFHGDGYDDLVLLGSSGRNSIHLLRGSPGGLTAAGDVRLMRSTPGVKGRGAFTGPFTVGDFNGDDKADLAVTALDYDTDDTPDTSVFYGGPSGISADRDQLWRRTTVLPAPAGDVAAWGRAMATGDFDGDGLDELAIASRDESRNGEVVVLRGGVDGLTLAGAPQVIGRGHTGLTPTQGPKRKNFGSALAAADSNGDGRDDLAIAAGGGLTSDTFQCASGRYPGVVHLLMGSDAGLTTEGSVAFGVANIRVEPPAQRRCKLGRPSFEDHNGDGKADLDLFLGARVIVLPGSDSGPTSTGVSAWSTAKKGIKGTCCFNTLPTR